MKRFYFILFIFFAFLQVGKAENSEVRAINGKKLNANKMLAAGSSGNEFVIAIPANDNNGSGAEYISIYLASPYNTVVKFKDNMSSGAGRNYGIAAYKITTIARTDADEIKDTSEFEKPISRTFTLTSTKRFTVYVIDKKSATSDGYMAIPTASWGTKYIHLCNYDNPESYTGTPLGYNQGSGFIVLAKSDNTHITIRLVDQANKNVSPGYGLGRTVKGHKGGDSIKVTLNAGQAYLIQGNGAGSGYNGTIGYLDLSGSEVESDSLIGLISYHNRTDLPVNLAGNRNYLVEMLPPVSLWGKTIASYEFTRSGTGDLFRVVAAEDSTSVNIIWVNGKMAIKDTNVVLNKGDIWEYLNNIAPRGSNRGVTGACMIRADKPVMANKYAYSSSWDGNTDFGPFMITLSPIEQYIPATTFQVPSGFSKNYFDLIIKGYFPEDTLNEKFIDPQTKQPYSSVVINNMKLSSVYFGSRANFMEQIHLLGSSRIPTSGGEVNSFGDTIGGLYWATIPVTEGVYRCESEGQLTSFGGYIYGAGNGDGYGWPVGNVYKQLYYVDLEKPIKEYKIRSTNYAWEYRYADSLSYDINDSTIQKDLGLSLINLDRTINASDGKSWSYNCALIDSAGIAIDSIKPSSATYTFTIKVLDTTSSARAIVVVKDSAGNYSQDTLNYKYYSYVDKEAPQIYDKNTTDSLSWTFFCTDSKSYLINDSTYQKDNGLSQITLIENDNFNLLDSANTVVQWINTSSAGYTFRLKVVDITKAGYVVVKIEDKHLNCVYDTINYSPNTIGVLDGQSSNIISVSPNPAVETLTISLNSDSVGYYELSIYNSLGEKIRSLSQGYLSEQNKTWKFPTAGLSSGTYYIKFKIGDSIETKKMIILK